MAQARQASLRANWLGLVLWSLVAGCTGPTAPQAVMPPAQSPTGFAPEQIVGATVAHVDIRPENTGRRVLATGTYTVPSQGTGAHRVFGQTNYAAMGRRPVVTGTNGVYLADPFAATVYQVPAVGPYAYNPVVSGDGRFIAYTEGGDLQILDMATQLVRDFPSLGGPRRADDIVDFDVDDWGNVGYVDGIGRVHVYDTNIAQDYVVPVATRGLEAIGDISMSGDGRVMAMTGYSNGRTDLLMTDLATGSQYTVPFVPSYAPVRNLELSPTGDQVLYSEGDRTRVLDLRTGFTDNLPLLNQGYPVDAGFFDPTGRTIVFEQNGQVQVYDRATNLIDTMPIYNRAIAPGLLF